MKDWEFWRETQQYNAWRTMRQRCSNPRHGDYARYGGRGITVCARWTRFANFLADMGERPPGKTLDRKDNNGPYSPENCRWATASQQQRNTRRNRVFEFRGERRCVADWAEHFGMARGTLENRLFRGISFEDAVMRPAQTRNTTFETDGESLTLRKWAAKLGLTSSAIAKRLKSGWSLDAALTTPKIPFDQATAWRRTK